MFIFHFLLLSSFSHRKHYSFFRDITVQSNDRCPINGIYVCEECANRFVTSRQKTSTSTTTISSSSSSKKKKQQNSEMKVTPKRAILFGSVEMKPLKLDKKKRYARTSFNTPNRDLRTCRVVRVHALWEPSSSSMH